MKTIMVGDNPCASINEKCSFFLYRGGYYSTSRVRKIFICKKCLCRCYVSNHDWAHWIEIGKARKMFREMLLGDPNSPRYRI